MKLTIILIHHQMQIHLRQCLNSIEMHALADGVETVVTHLRTATDDGGWIRAEFPWVRVVYSDCFGIASMRNIALRAADKDSHAFVLDADARVQSGTVRRLLEFLRANPRAAAVGPRTIRPDGTLERNAKRFYTPLTVVVRRSPLNHMYPQNRWTRNHLMMDKDWSIPFECDWIAGAGMFLRAEALNELGGFDERFTFGFEDVDWCFRARKAGWAVWYCPDATIEHHVQRRSASGLNRMTIEHLKSLGRFWTKHGRLNLPSEKE